MSPMPLPVSTVADSFIKCASQHSGLKYVIILSHGSQLHYCIYNNYLLDSDNNVHQSPY